jgi:hypothetical protein
MAAPTRRKPARNNKNAARLMNQELLAVVVDIGRMFMKSIPISLALAALFTVLTSVRSRNSAPDRGRCCVSVTAWRPARKTWRVVRCVCSSFTNLEAIGTGGAALFASLWSA